MRHPVPHGYASVDVGKGHHWVCLIDEAGTTVWPSKVVNGWAPRDTGTLAPPRGAARDLRTVPPHCYRPTPQLNRLFRGHARAVVPGQRGQTTHPVRVAPDILPHRLISDEPSHLRHRLAYPGMSHNVLQVSARVTAASRPDPGLNTGWSGLPPRTSAPPPAEYLRGESQSSSQHDGVWRGLYRFRRGGEVRCKQGCGGGSVQGLARSGVDLCGDLAEALGWVDGEVGAFGCLSLSSGWVGRRRIATGGPGK